MMAIALAETAYARMYQWTEPESGSTQLSGKPPVWYRSDVAGPRVFVFENGRLVDDTAVEVDDDVRERMRQQAFILVEEDRQKASEKMVKSQELKQKFVKEKPSKTEQATRETMEQEPSREELAAEASIIEEHLDNEDENQDNSENKLDELRAMIEEWEKAQTESAKKALE